MSDFDGGYGPQRQAEILDSAGSEDGLSVPISFEDLEKQAKENMGDAAWAFAAGGAGDEKTMAANREAFDRWDIVPRMLRDVSKRELSVDLCNRQIPAPICLAPIGVQTLYAPDGELATASAAADLDIPMCVSTASSVSFEDIADAMSESPRLAQLYLTIDEAVNASFVTRVEEAGYDAVVITVDTAYTGWRTRFQQNGSIPLSKRHGAANFFEDPVFRDRMQSKPEDDPEAAVEEMIEITKYPGLTWEELQAVAEQTNLPVLVKGILHPQDARRAMDFADGVVVSNHGGRQVDGAVGALEMLPQVADALGDEGEIIFDSGIRSGDEVLKALALGADAVGIGRPYIYGLAAGDATGVSAVLKNVVGEFDLTLALSGHNQATEVTHDVLTECSS
jgi:isopentenyl-diphosphate delta-isomerase